METTQYKLVYFCVSNLMKTDTWQLKHNLNQDPKYSRAWGTELDLILIILRCQPHIPAKFIRLGHLEMNLPR